MICIADGNEAGGTQQAKPVVTIGLATPYLTESVEEFLNCRDPRDTLFQLTVAGYNPYNFAGLSEVETPKHIVQIQKIREEIETNPSLDFIITGCTEDREANVISLKGSGLLVARYSMFYRHPSQYTGNSAAKAGYAFDIPKVPAAAFALVQHDGFLSALKARKVHQIEEALAQVNKGKEGCPILRTSYLDDVLMGSGGL